MPAPHPFWCSFVSDVALTPREVSPVLNRCGFVECSCGMHEAWAPSSLPHADSYESNTQEEWQEGQKIKLIPGYIENSKVARDTGDRQRWSRQSEIGRIF